MKHTIKELGVDGTGWFIESYLDEDTGLTQLRPVNVTITFPDLLTRKEPVKSASMSMTDTQHITVSSDAVLYDSEGEALDVIRKAEEESLKIKNKFATVPFRDMKDDDINWQKVRIDISSRVVSSLLEHYGYYYENSNLVTNGSEDIRREKFVDVAVKYADALIERLKKS